MKQVLIKLRENIEIPNNTIQFRIGNQFYELEKSKKGDWIPFTLFGKDLRLNVNKLKGLERSEVEEVLKAKFPNIDIY